MTAALWEQRRARLVAIDKALRPTWHRRIAAVAHRLTPATCWRCLGEHGIHLASCPRALRSLTAGNTALQLGAAVIRAEQRLRARRVLAELFAQVHAGVAPADLEVKS